MRGRHVLAAVFLAGCTGPSGPPPETRIEIHAVPTLVEQCDDQLTMWTVNVRETGEHYASACDQAITVSLLQPYEHFTLEIAGYSPEGLCWIGKCAVTPLPGLDIAECPHAVIDVCADGGEP